MKENELTVTVWLGGAVAAILNPVQSGDVSSGPTPPPSSSPTCGRAEEPSDWFLGFSPLLCANELRLHLRGEEGCR